MVVRNDINSTSAILSIAVSKENLVPRVQNEFKQYRQKAQIKGFRVGQAPPEFIKKIYGASIVGNVLQEVFHDELVSYLRDNKIDILGQPLPVENQEKYSLKIDKLDDEYKVDYEIGFVPDFEVKGIGKSDSYERLTVSDLDALAEKDLEYARKRMGQRTNPETDIQANDMIKIAAKELDADIVMEAGYETDISILVDRIANEELKTQILFLKKGDTLRFNARDLENTEKEEFYRRYILNIPVGDQRVVGDHFEGVIQEVSRVEDAELGEEFYSKYFGNENVNSKESAIEEVKKGVLQFYDGRSDALLMRSFQEKLMEINSFELPESFLLRWVKLNNQQRLTNQQIENDFPSFVKNLRWTIIRDKIKAQLDVFVTDEDLTNHFADRIASYFQGQVDRAFCIQMSQRFMKDKKEVQKAEEDIEWVKLTQAIKAEVTIVDKAIPSEEFHKIIDEITKLAKTEQAESAALIENMEP
jgi:trigger factor